MLLNYYLHTGANLTTEKQPLRLYTSLNETDTWGNLNARAVVTLSPNVKITESKVTPKGYELSI